MAQYAYTFTSGDVVTPTKLNNARTVSDIVNADIKSDAAIAGTKIAPDFGSQNVVTSGTVGSASNSTAQFVGARSSTDANPADLIFEKSRGTLTSKTVVAASDVVGRIRMFGYDGSAMVEAARIQANVDGTPSTNDMPGRLIFSTTADGASSPTERMRITSDGRLILNSTSANTTVAGSIITDGRIQSDATYSITTANAANVHVISTGLIVRSTSSARYKTDIETAQSQYSDAAVFNTRPVWFRSTCQDDRNDWSHWGFIAEEVADIDPRLVTWGPDESGTLRPEGVQYDRFVPHLCAVVKDQRDKIAALEARIAALEAA